jgi:hypothetical protein
VRKRGPRFLIAAKRSQVQQSTAAAVQPVLASVGRNRQRRVEGCGVGLSSRGMGGRVG